MFTYQQFLSAIRWASTVGGTMLLSYGVSVNGALWEAATGVVIALAPFGWSMLRHTTLGTVLAADALPSVAGVVMKQTAEGRSIADSPSSTPTVVAAGTVAATQVAAAGSTFSKPL